jgi:hypothetical protein
MRLALGTPLAQGLETAFVRARQGNRQTLWKQIIARVTGSDTDLIGLSAQANNVAG